MQSISIEDFLAKSSSGNILDVRSPAEFAHAHIPGAHSFPLFSDEERHKIGLLYKTVGQQAAVILGLEFVGPKLADFARRAEKFRGAPLFIHCWRGGMRSQSMATLLSTLGHKVFLLQKGYKAYRNYVINVTSSPYKLVNIAGYTGSAKTEILHILKENNHQILDLEGIAKHKGSAFGNLEQHEQPSSEQFENNLAEEILKLDVEKIVFIEDEGLGIGHVILPASFYALLQKAPMIFIERSNEMRLFHLTQVYSNKGHIEGAKAAFARIAKRLGGQNVQDAFDAIDQNDIQKAISIALRYYDKYYYKKLNSRRFSRFCKVDGNASNEETAQRIVEKTKIFYD